MTDSNFFVRMRTSCTRVSASRAASSSLTRGMSSSTLSITYDCPLGIASSRIFGDFSKYFVRKVGAPVIGVLRERFWPDMGIAGLIRFDGELGDTAAIKHLIQA